MTKRIKTIREDGRRGRGLRLTALVLVTVARMAAEEAPAVAVFVPAALTHKVEPRYSAEGYHAGVQGTAVLEVLVSEVGKVSVQSILSPLGFGLDEKAQEAVEQWRFEPARKYGKPVKILATIEVNFRFLGRPFDGKADQRRTQFNLALPGLNEARGPRHDRAVDTIRDLAARNFPPAVYALGKLHERGDGVTRDPERAARLIRKAADSNYAPALFDEGLAMCNANPTPVEFEKGMRLVREAAVLGSYPAQFHLGDRYENGIGVSREPERAQRYFRLCAASGHSDCQLRLGKMLLAAPNRRERDYVQAIAWLELAAAQGDAEARAVVEAEAPQLTAEQAAWARRLEKILVHRQ